MHLLAFLDFLPKHLMFPQILRSTQLDTPCLQQFRKKKTRYDGCVLLGVFGQQCCVRLHGPKSLTSFKLYARSANKSQLCCGSMQTDATCWAQQRCVLLANNVASVCIGLKDDDRQVASWLHSHVKLLYSVIEGPSTLTRIRSNLYTF